MRTDLTNCQLGVGLAALAYDFRHEDHRNQFSCSLHGGKVRAFNPTKVGDYTRLRDNDAPSTTRTHPRSPSMPSPSGSAARWAAEKSFRPRELRNLG